MVAVSRKPARRPLASSPTAVCLIGGAALSAAANSNTLRVSSAWPSRFRARSTPATSASSKQDGDRVDLEIVKDHMTDFYQWFYFRLAGGGGPRSRRLRIINCADRRLSRTAGPTTKPACRSTARNGSGSTDTSYADGVLTIRFTPDDRTCVWIAYFAPYSMERHHDLVATDRGACRASTIARSARASTARTSTA